MCRVPECRRDLLRNPGKAEAVTKAGAGHVLIDGGHNARQVREILAGGADAALELVGTPTLPDTLRSVRVHGGGAAD
jgi:NADPH2:quinone reductase